MRYGRLAGAVLITAFIAISAALISCDGNGNGGADGETLDNPGFEDGMDGWASLESQGWEPRFDISSDVAHAGDQSALLRMRVPPEGGDVRIFGVTQEVSPEEFPAQLSGWYRIENWQRATAKQYLQAVVIVWDAENKPEARFPNHQVRYILGGIDQPPFEIANAKYVFSGPLEPQQGEWLHFEYDVAADFERLWGAVPVGFDRIRLLFEVRYDDRQPDEQPSADVYYDDLHLGARTAESVPAE